MEIKFYKNLFFGTLLGLIISPISVFAVTTIGDNVITSGNIIVGGSLEINGALNFSSGAISDYILTTNASGDAIWIPVSTALSNASTDDLPEGPTNFYFTSSRFDTELSGYLGASDGVAPLDASATVPMTNLPVGVPGGLATLDGSGKVFVSQLPSIVISNSYVVGNESAILSLSCALLLALAPEASLKFFGSIFHGIDMTKIAASVTISGVLTGLVAIAIVAFVAGWLFAVIYNYLQEKTK